LVGGALAFFFGIPIRAASDAACESFRPDYLPTSIPPA
jgi:hypothetical protein